MLILSEKQALWQVLSTLHLYSNKFSRQFTSSSKAVHICRPLYNSLHLSSRRSQYILSICMQNDPVQIAVLAY